MPSCASEKCDQTPRSEPGRPGGAVPEPLRRLRARRGERDRRRRTSTRRGAGGVCDRGAQAPLVPGEGPLEAWVWRIVLNAARSDVRRSRSVDRLRRAGAANGHPEQDAELRAALAACPSGSGPPSSSATTPTSTTRRSARRSGSRPAPSPRPSMQRTQRSQPTGGGTNVTELDRASLDRLLPATPGPADWDDVMSRAGTHQRRRRRLLVVLAAVALVSWGRLRVRHARASSSTRLHRRTSRRSGVEHAGARRARSALFRARPWPPREEPGMGVRRRQGDLTPGHNVARGCKCRCRPASSSSGSHRDGVEKLRSEVAESTGVGQPPPGGAPLSFHTIIEVREGARLVRVEWSSDQAAARSATLGSSVVTAGSSMAGTGREGICAVEVRGLLRRAVGPCSRAVADLEPATGTGR